MRNCTREMKEGLRVRQSGADLKPPQAVVVKGDGGERCGNAGTRIRQARLREASASKPSMKCQKRIRRCQNRGRRQPSRGGRSRMTRECQVRFCEELGVNSLGLL